MLDSMKSLFRGFDAMRLLPRQTTFPSDINVFSVANLLIVSFLFILARGIAGASTDIAASVIITVAATALFFAVGLIVRVRLKGQAADDEANSTATWLFLYWIFSIVVIDVTDVPLVLSVRHPLGYYIFYYFPVIFLAIDLEIPPAGIDVLRVIFVSLVVWVLLLIKTNIQVGPFPARNAFISWQFLVFAGINTILLLAVVLTPY
jgi:hypothetical protein